AEGERPAPADAAANAPTPAVAATGNGLLRAPTVAAGLEALRAGSYPLHPEVARLVQAIRARHPGLPISPDRVFLVHDRALLQALELPEEAAGAARIVTDGKTEVPVVVIVALNGVPADQFVEFSVHEAVHLMDDGILRVPHDAQLLHFFAEGWTQKRAVDMANGVLDGLGLARTPGRAYHKEIALIEAFSAAHGTAALDSLVRTGSESDLRRALGPRWVMAERIASARAPREKRLNALIALVNAGSYGPAEERALADYLNL
ncbi:MAG: hypothetical protein KGM24_09970, partial [Elusimicrobia bacterium]|nr:hypothetical protein [Elusimicrobiota bacterium]